ncbi:hypothetical protein EDC04DRAFT_2903029 [Pisolithus marmoratus]|nr:hypothetical protein EDC04DRAFT_2903029 [Pisolithus marmoratus]
MYANLKCDHDGAAHKSSASATCLKKKKTSKPMHDIEVISIPDSDEIMPNPVPHMEAKHPAPSVHDSDEIKEISPVVKKSTQLQPRVVILQPSVSKKCTRQVVKSEDDDDDSVNIGNSEYNPDNKASSNQESDTEEARAVEEGNVLEDKRQTLLCKRKCTFDDTGHDSKRLANNPKPVKLPLINPVTLSSKGKGKILNIATNVAVGNKDDALQDERQMSHGCRSTFDDTECASKRPAISPMHIKSPPIHPAMSSSMDKGNSQHVTGNKTTDVLPHTESSLDASKADWSLHTISLSLLPSPDEDGHMEIPKIIQSPVPSAQHGSSECYSGSSQMLPANHPQMLPANCPQILPANHPQTLPANSPQMPPANHPQMLPANCPQMPPVNCPQTPPASRPQTLPPNCPLHEPLKGSPSITHASDESQVLPPPAHLYSPFPDWPLPALPFDKLSQSSNKLFTRDDSTPTQDSKIPFNLHHRTWRPDGNIAPTILLVPSTDLLAAGEGQVCEEAGRVEIREAGCMEIEDTRLGAGKGATDSMDMAHQPTGKEATALQGTFHHANCTAPHEGFPPQYIYDYYPMHHPWICYERDPYAAQYHAVRAFPDHPSSFVHDPWEDGHADYEDQMHYVRGGSWYGPQGPNNQFSAYQGPYPPLRAHPSDAIPGYYYYLTAGMAAGPSQQQTYLPPAQSTAPQDRDTPPEPESYLELLTLSIEEV